MNKIKFSHDYDKLPVKWENTQAILIGIAFHPNIQSVFNMCPQLKTADTSYRGEEGQYPITFKEAIILTFVHLNSRKIFTTIRRYDGNKFKYYNDSLFTTFELLRVEQ